MTVRFRQGIWGLLAARTRVSLFPVGYRVDVTASPSAAQPGAAATGQPGMTGTDTAGNAGSPVHGVDVRTVVTDRLGGPVPIKDRLRDAGYLADDLIGDALLLADGLGKPLLIEGPAGVGKTELAKAAAAVAGARLLRLQCYEGIDEAKTLYEWNYKKQLLRIQAGDGQSWDETEADIFTPDFLLERPLLAAIQATDPVLLLIDEVDRVEVETEALLLEVLSEFQVSIPELGTIAARQPPLVFLTSNATRELSDALRRRCLYLHLDYPDLDRERQIIQLRVPDLDAALAGQAARIIHALRSLDLDKPPSISESVDWARSLVLLGVTSLDAAAVSRTSRCC